MDKKLIIVISISILIIAVLGFFAWQKYYRSAIQTPQTKTPSENLNVIENMPQTNPYEAKTNPFEEAKTNPFQDAYKNPFGK
ncbi:hypothetical protein A2999_00245 [Candidatus Wolfebacteria bacterium RIFCSPLOWO2_01_FULL_38_11]|uniref:Uncharacterized protein n=2 Tax=Candidatus Wolfeibacteriota TaxID=1752735 RepID=A0A0G0G063_9BACT|nr:MAG: hypothetical protein US36_C0001G0046 [Candidatus Wolfebacteria bacterium GW2011_GWC1_37_10]OGM90382.1 MAG: hypothetical protein A2999_00245 [Candidatus Wolfebacteria bacterium RIFCSPLOWO2_01_FULL_38_11]